MNDADLLRRVPLLAPLSDDLLDRLAAETSQVHVRAGEWLLHMGDDAESLYVITSGRLEVLADEASETQIRVLRRGAALGELALLTGGRRSASVRAIRDSELVELSRDHFETLLREVPAFAVGLTEAMGRQLAASRSPATGAVPPSVISLLSLDPTVPADARELLVEELGRHGSLAVLTGEDPRSRSAMSEALDQAERSADRVLLIGEGHDPEGAWNSFCLRESDQVVALTSGRPDPAWSKKPDLRDSDLIAVGRHPGESVLARFGPRSTRVVLDGDLRGATASLARRLTGRAIGVVLSGGGARAFAHLGAMEELIASGMVIDRIAGVSMGSVVAAGIALGKDPAELSREFDEGFVKGNPTRDYTLPLYSLIRGRRAEEMLKGLLGEMRIEELKMQYFALSCDLVAREKVIHHRGPVFDAVRASLSIPAIFPPIQTADGRLLVDGGVLDNLPVSTMAAAAEGPVIAVDVTGKMDGGGALVRPRKAKLSASIRRLLTGREAELPRLSETVMRTVTVGSIDTVVEARKHTDFLIQPEVDGCGMLDWSQLETVREAGRKATREAIDGFPEELWS